MKLTLVPSGEFMMGGGESAEATAAFFQRVAQPHFVNPLRTIPARTEGLIARLSLLEMVHSQRRTGRKGAKRKEKDPTGVYLTKEASQFEI